MPSASLNERDPGAGAGRARIGRIDIAPETRRLIDSSEAPQLGALLRIWESLAAEKGRYPARHEIDPALLGPKLLPNVFLVDVVPTPGRPAPRFRFRLLGQAIIEREPTRPGTFVDQLGPNADLVAIEQQYVDAFAGKVWVREASLAWIDPRGGYLRYRVMMLPLSEDGETVTHLIGLALYDF
jgi:hypothetical protein